MFGFRGIWKYYPPTGVLKRLISCTNRVTASANLEVLPAYWGIETAPQSAVLTRGVFSIWKYYPPTGVLKLDLG